MEKEIKKRDRVTKVYIGALLCPYILDEKARQEIQIRVKESVDLMGMSRIELIAWLKERSYLLRVTSDSVLNKTITRLYGGKEYIKEGNILHVREKRLKQELEVLRLLKVNLDKYKKIRYEKSYKGKRYTRYE